MDSDLKIEIEKSAREWGATLIGFSNVSDLLPHNLKKYPFAITTGVRLSDAIIDEIDDGATFSYFHHYRHVNALIDQIGLRILLLIQQNGYNAYTIGASQSIPNSEIPYSALFSHKIGAVRSGLGWVGKSALFISNDYGPRVRLGTILTDFEVDTKSSEIRDFCGACTLCIDSCPSNAILDSELKDRNIRDNIYNPKLCSDYMKKNFQHIGRGVVCGICIRVCPHKQSS